MVLDTTIFKHGLVRYILDNGGELTNLVLPHDIVDDDDILSFMNPSICLKDENTAYINIRGVDYNLHATYNTNITIWDQPTVYVNRDTMHLKTINYVGELDLNTLELSNVTKVDTSLLDEDPKWDFVGLEDARILVWDNKLYLCGVRRDWNETGQGRMELSEIQYIDNQWREVSRTRVPANYKDDSYCEKNWMPFIDKQFTWIKWNNPVTIAYYDRFSHQTIEERRKNLSLQKDLDIRGDSHVVRINGHYWALGHTCQLEVFDTATNARRARYEHHLLQYDDNMDLIWRSPSFMYSNDFDVEFGCGLAYDERTNKAYIAYAEDDTSSYILKFDANLLFN